MIDNGERGLLLAFALRPPAQVAFLKPLRNRLPGPEQVGSTPDALGREIR